MNFYETDMTEWNGYDVSEIKFNTERDYKTQCPVCAEAGNDKSKNNLHVYKNNGGCYCFGCSWTIPSEEQILESDCKDKSELKERKFKVSKSLIDEKKLSKEELKTIVDETFQDPKGWRGLEFKYIKDLGIRFKNDSNGNPCEMLTSMTYTQGGKTEIVGLKSRKFPKDFSSPKGYTGGLCDLIGYAKFKNKTKTLVITEGECFTGDTEVMTDRGFVKFSDLSIDEKILQVNKDLSAEFVKPTAFLKKEYSGNLIKYESQKVKSLTTENHNMVYQDKNGCIYKQKANEHLPSNKYIPHSVKIDGVGTGLTLDQIALTLAVCADSKIDTYKNGVLKAHFGLIKDRKISRLKGILSRLGIKYTSYVNSYDNGKVYTTFNFQLPDYIKDKSIPKQWLKDASLVEREFIINEIGHWDGHFVKGRKSIEFTSKHINEALFVQELAHTCGYYASVRERSNKLGVWFRTMISLYDLKVGTQSYVKEFLEHNGFVYCVTVPSGMILTRYNGSISVCGNCDYASAVQMYQMDMERKNKSYEIPAVVSTVNGVKSLIKSFTDNDTNFEFFKQFERVILALDNDESGRESVEEFIEKMPRGTLYKANMRFKDANEYLQRGKISEWVNDTYWNVTACSVAKIAGSGDWLDKAREELNTPRLKLPKFMDDVNKATRGGLPMGRYIIFAGASSIGKTVFTNSMIYDWVMQDTHKIGIVSLELSQGQYYIEMLSRHIGLNIDDIDSNEERATILDNDEIIEAGNNFFRRADGSDRFHVVDDRDSDIKKIQELCEDLVVKHGVQVLVLDPISDLTQRLDNQQQVVFNSWIKSFIKKHNVLMIGISHVKKGDKEYDKGDVPDEGDLIGSYSGGSSAAAIFFLSRNKMSDDDVVKNTTLITTPKIRWTGRTGVVGKVFFDHNTRRLSTLDDFFNGGSKENVIEIVKEDVEVGEEKPIW